MNRNSGSRLVGLVAAILFLVGCSRETPPQQLRVGGMQVYYLEVVTRDVEAVCATYTEVYSIQFGEPDALLGDARTASLRDGGLIGVRAPLREDEQPVVRPYWLVENIDSAVAAVEKAGAAIAVPPMEIPGHGTFAIYFLGDNQLGFWQLPK